MTSKDAFLQLAQSQGARQIRVTVFDGSSVLGMRDVQLYPDIGDDVSDDTYDWACREIKGEDESETILVTHPAGL